MKDLGVFIVPVVGMLIPIVAIIAGSISQIHRQQMRRGERMALIARGVPLPEIEAYMKTTQPEQDEGHAPRDPWRSLGTARRTAIVLISAGASLLAFLLILGAVLLVHVSPTAGWVVMACSASGLVPMLIGLGFAFDYRLQRREMSRFGLEVETDRA